MGELRASIFQHLAFWSVHVGDVSPLQLRTFCTKHQFSSIFVLDHHRTLRIHRSRLSQHKSLAHLLLNSPSSLSHFSLPRWHCKGLLGPNLWMKSNCDKSLNQSTTESLGRLAHLLGCSLREYGILQGEDYLQWSVHWQTKARWVAWWNFCTFINYKRGHSVFFKVEIWSHQTNYSDNMCQFCLFLITKQLKSKYQLEGFWGFGVLGFWVFRVVGFRVVS